MSSTAELLARELGAKRVVTTDAVEPYRRDESGLVGEPDAVVVPASTDEVVAVMRLAAAEKLVVVPRGAGSGKVGGCVPTRGGVVLDLSQLTGLALDDESLLADAGAGVITQSIDDTAAELGLFYPPDPASLGYSTIGGNIATNAGGPSAFKYGVTGSYVLGVEVVTAAGELLRLGHRSPKGVSGLDLVSGFVGSEGTLGVVTAATVRLIPRPRGTATLLATFDAREQAGAAVKRLCRSGLWPRTLELIDATTLAIVRTAASKALPPGDGSALLIELDGPSAESDAEVCGELLTDAVHVAAATTEAERRNLWEARRGISPALKSRYPHKISEDICVPRGRIPEMLAAIDDIATSSAIPMAAYGHAGDGNLHVNFLFSEARDSAAEGNLHRALRTLFERTIALGGTLSGEHGIGVLKREFMPIEHDELSLSYQRKLKALWDPEGRMNPGKVLPEPGTWTE
ncbi:MAG: FAD-binding protein [Deltaproteobacteria bacterium]|nr:FAD-binding protein [Deltaproteobacteria bacterium]